MFSSRIPPLLVPNAWTRSLSDRRARGLPVLDLSAGNPTLTGLSLLAEAGEQFARCSAGAYEPAPLGQWHARAAVARYFEGRGLTVRAESVVLTASTSESYAQLFRLLASPGERIAAPVPGYPLFEPLARAEGVTLSRYRLEFDGEWHLDRGSFVRAMQGARAVIVVEPNYPTGSCLSAEDRAFVLEHCGQQGAAVISDEVFGDFPLGVVGVRPLSWLAGEEPVPVPVFVLGGLSKLCGLPQFKLGWIVVRGPAAARAEALAALEWLGDLFLGLAGPVQAALPSLLELRHEFGRRVRERTRANWASWMSSSRSIPNSPGFRHREGGLRSCSFRPAATTRRGRSHSSSAAWPSIPGTSTTWAGASTSRSA